MKGGPDEMTTRLPLAELIGRSASLEALRAQLLRLARISEGGRLPPAVLLLGETGTGKGMVAGLLHRTGRPGAGPFIDVNCAAIPETLLESELFGFERGAFTDARASKPGLFEAAHHGTLFLDEIGELPDVLQVKVLTAIESRQVRRLGSTRSEPMDVWIIAATSTDLSAAIRAGRFRHELYHRLSTVVLELPPLRARDRDVLDLADHFLERAAAEHGIPVKMLAEDARAALLAYQWPGNVRELANVLERVMLLEDSPVITAAMLSLVAPGGAGTPDSARVSLRSLEALRAEERQQLVTALDASRGNITRAAARLGIHRNTLRYRLSKHRLSLRDGATGGEADGKATAAALPSATPTAAKTIRWEERLIAVLGVTIAGSVAARSFELAAVMADLVEMVTSFGARIEQFAPSELVAVFGIDPMEDAARRAVLAAQAMLQTLLRSEDKKHGQFAIHVGSYLIARAGVVTGLDARARRRATDIVSGLLRQAGPDEVVVDLAAARFLERHFAMEILEGSPAGSARVVGRQQPGFEVVGRTLSPFVGRARELETIHELMARAEAGEAQILGLVGEPGVGKSRLVFELTHSDRVEGWLVLATGSASYGAATRHQLVADLVRSYFRISDGDTPRDIQEKVTGRLLTLDRALEPTLPAIFALLEMAVADPGWQSLDPSQRRQRTLGAVKRLLHCETRIRPLLVVFEDLHWIDAETQTFLDTLVDSVSTARLFLLSSYRPEYRHAWRSKANYTQLRLDPLPPESAEELLDALLGHDALLDPLKRLLVTRTGRNPLFIEESVRTLVETRGLAGERGAYRLVQPVDAIQVPATVQAILAARIDRLPGEDKRLLEVASVIGKDVPFVLLEAIAGMSEGELRQGIARLQGAEFLYETSTAPDTEYTFKHALTHEVTYRGLLHERRRELHARIVDAIEMLYQHRLAEQMERLAHHSVQGELPAKAVQYLRQAGLKALGRSAHREAASYFEQALIALGRLPDSRQTLEQAIDLRFDLRDALMPLGEFRRMLSCLREAEGLARMLDDRRRLGRMFNQMCHGLYITGHPTEALASGRSAQAIADALADVSLQVGVNHILGFVCLAMGDFRRADELQRKVLGLLETNPSRERPLRDAAAAVEAHASLTWSFAERGEFDEGIAHGQECLRLAKSLDHPYSLAEACWRFAHLHIVRGEFGHAARLLERGVALAREWQLTFFSAIHTGTLGYVYTLSGRMAEGLPLLEHALSATETMGYGNLRPRFLIYLGEAYLLATRFEDAHELVGRALAFAREHGQRPLEAQALSLLGEVTARRGSLEDAASHYRDALALAEKLEMRPLAAHCHFGLGKLYGRAGDRQKAQEHLTTATTLYREMGMTYWLERAEPEMRESR
jgi:DNA-binding NtrC family response regulator/tetratricopeptide (TPR) repeat protein